jgi:hypothetical protein
MTKSLSLRAKLATSWISSRLPAYAPASASILFPSFWFAAERHDSLVRFTPSRSRTVFTKTDSPASLGALGALGTSRRIVRSLRTAPAVLLFNGSGG